MRKTCCLIILCFSCFGAAAQHVAVINGHPVSQKEFIWIYKKHRPDAVHPQLSDLVAFLNQYIDFKLKVEDARAAGMDKDSTYLAEVSSYQQALFASLPPEARSADYSLVMNEYKEALLLYTISRQQIWERMEDNEAAVETYYQAHTDKYAAKPFEEVKSEVAADYQQQMECDWVTALRKKYTITVDQPLLSRLVK